MKCALLVCLLAGCMSERLVTGHWEGCAPGDDVEVTWTPGTGTDDVEDEKHLACEAGGFAMRIWADSFVLGFEVNGDPFTHVSKFFDNVEDDYDVGVIEL